MGKPPPGSPVDIRKNNHHAVPRENGLITINESQNLPTLREEERKIYQAVHRGAIETLHVRKPAEPANRNQHPAPQRRAIVPPHKPRIRYIPQRIYNPSLFPLSIFSKTNNPHPT